MTMRLIRPPLYVGPKILRDATQTTQTLDATSEYVAWIIQAPKTGTIDRIHFYAGTVTANGDGLRCRIETVSASTGEPSGTLVAGSSEVTHTTTTANAWNRGTAGLNAAVTAGDFIAVIVRSPASGTTFNGVIRTKFSTHKGPGPDSANLLFPYIVNALPTATKDAPGAMCMALEYDDGTTPYIESAIPISSMTVTSFNSTSTPDERGNLFQLAARMRVVGVYHQLVPAGSSQSCDVVLYNAAGSALATINLDCDISRALASAQSYINFFPTPITLEPDTDYRLVLRPTVTSSMSMAHFVIDTSAGGIRLREATVGDLSWKLTTRSDAGSWTNTDDSIACIGLIVDQLDDSGFPSAEQIAAAVGARQIPDSYSADGAQPTADQAILEIRQMLQEAVVSGSNILIKKPDGSTTAFTIACSPSVAAATSRTRSA